MWIIIHSGSRGIGHGVASYYMGMDYSLDVKSSVGKDYIKDMEFCLEFALENRLRMVDDILGIIINSTNKPIQTLIHKFKLINRNHNHAELKDGLWIHRKGATHAEEGMMGVIPANMKDGSFIIRGKGNPDSLCSSSHGAGRVLSRNQAKKKLNLDHFSEMMAGIKAKIGKSTLDECPSAYKDIYQVMENQSDLVDIVSHIKPIINIKG